MTNLCSGYFIVCYEKHFLDGQLHTRVLIRCQLNINRMFAFCEVSRNFPSEPFAISRFPEFAAGKNIKMRITIKISSILKTFHFNLVFFKVFLMLWLSLG
jgi:hypothetical protein